MTELLPEIRNAKYAKGQKAVYCPSNNGLKSRAARLAEALKGRYSRRENSYIMSPKKAARLVDLFTEGWDANTFSLELIPPNNPL